MSKVCAQCNHYIGGGDWDLCCGKGMQRLCYEDTAADDCVKFEQSAECKNTSSYVGMFRCSICGHLCRESLVGDTCPECGNEVTGALWKDQKHYKERI